MLVFDPHRWCLFCCCCYCCSVVDSFALKQWLLEEGCPIEAEKLTEAATFGGHVRILEYLADERGIALTMSVMSAAAFSGNVATVEWAVARGVPGVYSSSC